MITDKQKYDLIKLQHQLKKVALPVGSLHSFWDLILDIKACLEGKPTMIENPEDLISAARNALDKKRAS